MRSGTGEPTSRATGGTAPADVSRWSPIVSSSRSRRCESRKGFDSPAAKPASAWADASDWPVDDRRMSTGACAPHGANFSGQRDPVHLGHLVIEKCHVEGSPLYDPFERHGGRVCIPGAHAPSLGLELQQKTIAGIVVDDQNALACQLRLLTVGGRTL